MQQQDHSESAAKNWLSDARDARRNLRQTLLEMPGQIPAYVTVDPPEVVRLAHNALFDYYSHVQVKQNATNGLWDEPLCEVSIPTDGEVDAGRTDEYGRAGLRNPVEHTDWRRENASLANLARLYDEDNHVRVRVLADGEPYSVERATYYVPPILVRKAFRQLDRVINDLGWVPEAATRERRAGPEEVLTHDGIDYESE
jgi:hypothetical protein